MHEPRVVQDHRLRCATIAAGERDREAVEGHETAARAPRLGGKVVVPPHDTPGFRSAVLADPRGAVFSVSQLTAR